MQLKPKLRIQLNAFAHRFSSLAEPQYSANPLNRCASIGVKRMWVRRMLAR